MTSETSGCRRLLRWPPQVGTPVVEALCRDHELHIEAALERKLDFWRQRGVTDPYDLAQRRQDYLDEHLDAAQQLLDKCLEAVPAYLEQHGVSDDEFLQAWALMGGIWNSVEFERVRHVVALQRDYPVLLTIARAMGRVADSEGRSRAHVGVGGTQAVPRAAPSDIEGITVGADLGALLPIERVQMVDDELDGLFAYRFATRRLQTFRFKSHVSGPARRVEVRGRRSCGPMIVCLDTSTSMSGNPQQIALSMIVKLLQMAMQADRPLLLVAFAVSARLIDVRSERARLLDFLRSAQGGDTDPEAMLTAVCDALAGRPDYRNADVLIISDFIVQRASDATRRALRRWQADGTHFYGLQIGIADARLWERELDRLWQVHYRLSIRPSYVMK